MMPASSSEVWHLPVPRHQSCVSCFVCFSLWLTWAMHLSDMSGCGLLPKGQCPCYPPTWLLCSCHFHISDTAIGWLRDDLEQAWRSDGGTSSFLVCASTPVSQLETRCGSKVAKSVARETLKASNAEREGRDGMGLSSQWQLAMGWDNYSVKQYFVLLAAVNMLGWWWWGGYWHTSNPASLLITGVALAHSLIIINWVILIPSLLETKLSWL